MNFIFCGQFTLTLQRIQCLCIEASIRHAAVLPLGIRGIINKDLSNIYDQIVLLFSTMSSVKFNHFMQHLIPYKTRSVIFSCIFCMM